MAIDPLRCTDQSPIPMNRNYSLSSKARPQARDVLMGGTASHYSRSAGCPSAFLEPDTFVLLELNSGCKSTARHDGCGLGSSIQISPAVQTYRPVLLMPGDADSKPTEPTIEILSTRSACSHSWCESTSNHRSKLALVGH